MTEDVLLVVDAVSSADAIDIETDRWGIDVLVTVQKAFMTPWAHIRDGGERQGGLRRQLHGAFYFSYKRVSFWKDLLRRHTPAVAPLCPARAMRRPGGRCGRGV